MLFSREMCKDEVIDRFLGRNVQISERIVRNFFNHISLISYIPIFCKEHLDVTRKMKIEDVRKCYRFKKFSDEDDGEEFDSNSNWTSKESSGGYEDEKKVGTYNVENTQIFSQQKRKRGRPRKYNIITPNNSISCNKKLKFEVSRNPMPSSPHELINPASTFANHMSSMKNNFNFQQGAFSNISKRDDKLKQRSFIQNNYTTCKTDSRSYFENERKRKFLGLK